MSTMIKVYFILTRIVTKDEFENAINTNSINKLTMYGWTLDKKILKRYLKERYHKRFHIVSKKMTSDEWRVLEMNVGMDKLLLIPLTHYNSITNKYEYIELVGTKLESEQFDDLIDILDGAYDYYSSLPYNSINIPCRSFYETICSRIYTQNIINNMDIIYINDAVDYLLSGFSTEFLSILTIGFDLTENIDLVNTIDQYNLFILMNMSMYTKIQ